MGRYIKNKVDFFGHDCIHGDSLRIVQNRYKTVGYACWFKLLELLGRTAGHQINMDNEAHIKSLILMYSECDIENETGKEIFNMFADLHMIDKDAYYKHNIIWSQHFVDRLSEVYRKRKYSAPEITISAPEIPQNPISAPETVISAPESIHSIEENSIEENSIEENSIEECPEAFRLSGLLAKEIFKFNPYHIELNKDKEGRIKAWAEPIEKLIRIDEQPSERIEKVIDYIFNVDTFWYAQILCGSTLRAKYNQVVSKMVAASKTKSKNPLTGAKKEKAYKEAKAKLTQIEDLLSFATTKLKHIGKDHPEYKETEERVEKLNKAFDKTEKQLKALKG